MIAEIIYKSAKSLGVRSTSAMGRNAVAHLNCKQWLLVRVKKDFDTTKAK